MYSREEIEEMIYSYRWRKNVLIDEGYIDDSNGVSQYGLEAALPKPQNTNSDKVQTIAMRNCVLSKVHDENMEVVSFIDEHEHSVDNDMNLNILYLIKKGKKPAEVKKIMNIGRTNYDSRIKSIVNVYYNMQKKHNQRNQRNQRNQHDKHNQH